MVLLKLIVFALIPLLVLAFMVQGEHFRGSLGSEYVLARGTASVTLIEDKERLEIVVQKEDYDTHLIDHLAADYQDKMRIVKSPKSSLHMYCTSIARYSPRNNFLVACTFDFSYVLFVSGVFFREIRTVSALNGKTVGVLRNEDITLLNKVLKCYRMALNNVRVIKLEDVSEYKKCDCLFMLFNPLSPHMEQIRQLKVSFYQYDDIDIDLTKKFLPACEVVATNVTKYFPTVLPKNGQHTFTVLKYRNVVYSKSLEYNYFNDMVAKYFMQNFEYLNVYEMLFRLHPRTKMLVEKENALHVPAKAGVPILEQFEVHKVMTIKPQGNIRGNLVSKTEFRLYGTKIEGAPIVVGDKIILENQDFQEENGEYIVRIVSEEECLLNRKTSVFLIDAEQKGNEYCVSNPAIKYKKECLDKKDFVGRQKGGYDVWDGPCVSSFECPFFRYNKVLKKYTGKCVNGLCEMPLGYTRIGYTKYINQ
jgi:hypothetical protein